MHLQRIFILMLLSRVFYKCPSGQIWLIAFSYCLFADFMSACSIDFWVRNVKINYVDLLILPCSSISFCFMYFEAQLLDLQTFGIVISS